MDDLDLVNTFSERFGNSSQQSRDEVVAACGSMENLVRMGILWAEHHNITGNSIDLIVAYATAVDLGYRIGLAKVKEKGIKGGNNNDNRKSH